MTSKRCLSHRFLSNNRTTVEIKDQTACTMQSYVSLCREQNPIFTPTPLQKGGYLFFSVKDRNLFHRVDTIGNIFTSGAATSENITHGVHEIEKISIFHRKKKICLFHAFKPFWEKLYQNPVQFFFVIPRGVPLPHSNASQYYVKREKCEVNDVIFPSGCEARIVNLGNKNMKIGIFTGGTSVRSKNISTDISRYPTGKHEIKL